MTDIASIHGKVVLITGGAGSLGKALTKSLLAMTPGPRKIIILSRDDQKHFQMEQQFKDKRIRYLIGDTKDFNRLCIAFKDVDYVIHAAALKHVDRGEYNSMEYKHNIIDSAEAVIMAAIECKVKRIVALSTDKSSSPANFYGTAKLASDRMFINANQMTPNTRFAVVRYGNVIGSNGSATQQLTNRKDDEIVIYDERMTRFWITLDYAAYLVIMLLTGMQGGELLIPKLPAMSVLAMFKVIKPNATITKGNIRPGEKIHESMITVDDAMNTYEYPHYFIIWPHGTRKTTFFEDQGKGVCDGFSYTSQNDPWRLNPDEALLMVGGTMLAIPDYMAVVKPLS